MTDRRGRTTRGKGRWIRGFGPRKNEIGKNLPELNVEMMPEKQKDSGRSQQDR